MKLFGKNINLRNISNLFFTEVETRSVNNPSTSLSNPAQWLVDFFGGKTKSGVNLTEDRALGISAIYAAVRIKADMIASLPFQVYEVDETGKKVDRLHPVNRLISKRPHRHLTSFQFRWTMQALLELRGNAFARIIRNRITQRPKELKIIRPSLVRYKETDNGDLIYYYKDKGKEIEVPFTDMIHLRNFSCDGINGLSPIHLGKENISLAVAAQEFEAAFFGNGAHISGYLQFPGKLGDPQKQSISKSWSARHGGFSQAGSTPVLEGGMEYKRIGLTPQESMLGDSRKLSVEDVSRWFNVPLYMLSALDKMSFNNIEQIARDFINKSLRPVARNWQEELDMKLLEEGEIMTHETGFDFTELLRADSEKTAEFIRTMINGGVMNIDDGRKMIGLNTLNTDWSKKHWIQLNMAGAKEEDRLKYVKNNTKNTKESKSIKRPISFKNNEVDPQLNTVE